MKKVGYLRFVAIGFGLFLFLVLRAGPALAATPVEDSFDAPSGYQGWTVYGDPAGPFEQVSAECVSGDCLKTTTLFQIPRVYKTGTPLAEGNITVYIRFHIGWAFFGMGNTVQLCTGAPLLPNPTNCDAWQEFAPNDDQWHQYLFAWRDHDGHKEVCMRRDDIDVGHCAWAVSLAHQSGDLVDTVVLAGEYGGRPDLGDLLWFDELSTSNVNTAAVSNVMFLPGLEGSRLYDANNNEVWLPIDDSEADTLRMDSSGESVDPGINTYRALDEANASQLYHNLYKSFLNDMKAWQTTYGITATTTPYDWRLSYQDLLTRGRKLDNGHISYILPPESGHEPYLIETLKNLATTSQTDKVTIIAHSNGGLLAKALVSQPGLSQYVDKLILVAVPQVGTPKAVGALLHGYEAGVYRAVSDQKARDLGQNMTPAYDLLPSDKYFQYTDNPVITFDPTTMMDWRNKYSDLANPDAGIHSADLLQSFMTDLSREKPGYSDLTDPEIVSTTLFGNATNDHSTLDSWTAPSGIQLITIAGWGNETLKSINYKRVPTATCGLFSDLSSCYLYGSSTTYEPIFTKDGDGTVIDSSAQWASEASYWMNLYDYNLLIPQTSVTNFLRTNHVNILEASPIREFLKNLLMNNSDVPGYITSMRPTADHGFLHFILHSPLTLGFLDSERKYTGMTSTTTLFEIPNVQYERFGDVQWLSVPKDLAGTIIMKGLENGSFTLDVQEISDDAILATTTFAGIPSSTSTLATIAIDPTHSLIDNGSLVVDFNGDGVVDFTENSEPNGVELFHPIYPWSGFSQPVNDTQFHPDQSMSVFKAGSAVPVKFQLKRLDGAIIQTASNPVWLAPQKISPLSAAVGESTYSLQGTSGTEYRWDSASQQYIYNWNTKGLTPGYWYKIFAQLDDGKTYFVTVGLK